MRRFWSLDHFYKVVNSYFVSYNVINDREMTMKETLLSFSSEAIHYRDIADSNFVEERNALLGTYSTLDLFMVCEFVLHLIF